jgi:hypothetical protein
MPSRDGLEFCQSTRMAKSEICAIDLQYEPENPVCQRAHSCETDFAISIKNDDDPGGVCSGYV